MNNNKTLAFLVVAALALAAVPAVSAQAAAPNAGTFVEAGDVDATYALTGAVGFTAICFIDQNNDGGQQPSEPVYLQVGACAAGIAAGDIRLTAAYGNAAGTVVTGADDDSSRVSAPTGWAYKFYDDDGNGIYNPGDTVFAGVVGAPSAPVAVNEIALNGPNAFQRVTSSSPLWNVPTLAHGGGGVGAAETFFDADGNAAYTVGDTVYLQLAPGAAPAVGDVRLTALGNSYSGGSVVAATNVDVTVLLPATPAGGACWVDENGDGLVSAGEPIYFQFTTAVCGPNSVAAGDYRVLATAGRSGGTIVSGADDDFSRNTVSFAAVGGPPALGACGGAAAICFYDADGSGAYSTNDPVYFDVDGSGTVTVNDVILSGANANTQVVSTSGGVNNGLGAHPAGGGIAGIGFYNADALGGAAVTTGDFLYLPTVAPGAATTPGVGALRLTDVGSYSAGSYVVSPDVDLNAAAIGTPAYAAFCYRDIDGDGIMDAGEPVYLQVACGTVTALSIRSIATSPYQGGTLVSGGDDDFSRTTVATPAGLFMVYDEDASTAYTNGEPVFVDFGAGGTVSTNDIAITTNEFSRVTSATPGFNSPLIAAPTGAPATAPAAFLMGADLFATETDGVAGFSQRDVVYIDMDASGSVTPGDVRLTALGTTTGDIGGDIGGGVGGGTGTGTSTTTTTTTGGNTGTTTTTQTTTDTMTQTVTDTGTDTETDGDTSTPGFELVALVAALGAALVLVRRRL